jgi:hypothetical protein
MALSVETPFPLQPQMPMREPSTKGILAQIAFTALAWSVFSVKDILILF